MPYIKQSKRVKLDDAIDQLHRAIVSLELDEPEDNNTEGNLNYVITRLIRKVYATGNYREINDAIGMLECVKLEHYRTKAAPYEDQKKLEYDDVE